MNTWRVLKLEHKDAFMNMAIDEAILHARRLNKVPNTLRFYSWTPSAVSIGRFQTIEKEVNLNECKKLGVDVVRRISGGGTVFHDTKGEITYSVIADKQNINANDSTQIYSKIYEAINEALRVIGITSDFCAGNTKNCPNLTVNGKKISGSAQVDKSGFFLQHGTLLLDLDLYKMFRLLNVPWANSLEQVVKVAQNRLTSISNELGHSLAPETAINAIAHGFQVALNIQVVENVQTLDDRLTQEEIEHANKLYKEKYATKEWTNTGKSKIA
ncbi:MAG: lipoate--protein ligase family protein [Crenarchaeota archaeon]|nr:lipoate--protein ligase family protein [Thermoproteota archaeon]